MFEHTSTCGTLPSYYISMVMAHQRVSRAVMNSSIPWVVVISTFVASVHVFQFIVWRIWQLCAFSVSWIMSILRENDLATGSFQIVKEDWGLVYHEWGVYSRIGTLARHLSHWSLITFWSPFLFSQPLTTLRAGVLVRWASARVEFPGTGAWIGQGSDLGLKISESWRMRASLFLESIERVRSWAWQA